LWVLNDKAMMPTADTMKHILIVDRDVAVTETLRQRLTDVGFAARGVMHEAAAAEALAAYFPHLVIIDWNLRGYAALDLIQRIRAVHIPRPIRLIILSALAHEQDVVAGFDSGADDYIVKPFSEREVVARVCAVLRPLSRDEKPASIACNSLVLDPITACVTVRGKLIDIRGNEYRLLEFLMSNFGRTFNRAQLMARVWGAAAVVDERTVDANVRRLRKILSTAGAAAYVQTVRGFGYRLAAPPCRTNGSAGSS
jgi:two-component system phosphate regulon response regulator PhoB